MRRAGPDRLILFAGQAKSIDRAAGPAHPRWSEALALGANELDVYLAPGSRTERLLVLDRVLKRYLPPLNPETDALALAAAASSDRRVNPAPRAHRR